MILLFLLYQLTIASAEPEGLAAGSVEGVRNSFTDYVKFLPKEIPLPTFYTEKEMGMLMGTSLFDALGQKLRGLEREFEMLRDRTRMLNWCRRAWWGLGLDADADEDDENGTTEAPLRFEDWKLADAIYRSRALELPRGKGIVMAPVLDMANHAPDDRYNARFEVDKDDNVMLVVRDGKTVESGKEITIMYGCGGACEMLFSYGFLDPSVSSAREMFLTLNIPPDDPLRIAKMKFSRDAPGVRLYVDQTGKLGWESDFVWWACVNEEDGLEFHILQSNDGQKEMKAVWKNREFEASEFKQLLLADELRDIFVLRSIVLIQHRVEQQGVKLGESEDMFEQARHATGVREAAWGLINKLRNLELEMLTAAFELLEAEVRGRSPIYKRPQLTSAQKAAMLNSDAVRRYLGNIASDGTGLAGGAGGEEEDFS